MLKVFLHVDDPQYQIESYGDYEIISAESLDECFIAAAESDSAVLIQLSHPISRVQDLFMTMENYDSLPTMLAFYVYSEEIVIYSLSNDGKFRNELTTLFLQTIGKSFPTVYNSWNDKDEIAAMSNKKLCLRSDRLQEDDYLVELFRGINKYEFDKLKTLKSYDLREGGYYLFAWYIREQSGLDYVHHTSLKNIYYFVGGLLQKECYDVLARYFGGEVFYEGPRHLYVLANVPYPQSSAFHKKILKDLSRDIVKAMGTADAHRYRSKYFKSATQADKAYKELHELQANTFFYRDEPLISPLPINSQKQIPAADTIVNTVGRIRHMIIYDTSNPQTIAYIQDLFLNILKPSMDYQLVLYCFSVILSAIYEKMTGGYHFAPNLVYNLTTNLHHSYIEIECNNLCRMMQLLQSDSKVNIPTTNNQLINKAISYIQTNYMHDISLVSISQHLNISSVYMSQLFKKELGLSPIKYIINYRIDRAKYFLKETDEPIYNIAIKVGFWEPKHFSKTFKRVTGMTPSQYKHL